MDRPPAEPTEAPAGPRSRLAWLNTARKIVAGAALAVFTVGPILAAAQRWPGLSARNLMFVDPLVGIATTVATGVLYAWLWLGIVTLLVTLVLGRVFCAWVCPLGILQDLFGPGDRDARAADLIRRNGYRRAHSLKYALLLAMLVLGVLGPVQLGLLDPLALYLRSTMGFLHPALQHLGLPLGGAARVTAGGVLLALVFVTVLAAPRWLPRAWCRVVCPLGAMLGFTARWSLFQVRRDTARCNGCKRCQQVCHGAAEPQGRFRPSECVMCMRCFTVCPEDALSYGPPSPRQASDARPVDLSRRRVMAASAVGLAAYPLLRTSESSANRPQPELIRPPGALEETEFLSRCVKCSACMQVCPTSGLQPALLEGGVEALWTPVLVPRLGHCAHRCTRCGESCPTGAIRQVDAAERVGSESAPPLKIGTAFFDRGRCLPWAMGRPCIVCQEVCPTSPKAIFFEEADSVDADGKITRVKRPRVDPHRCIGCGICESQCPVAGRAAVRVSSVGESRSRTNRLLLGQ